MLSARLTGNDLPGTFTPDFSRGGNTALRMKADYKSPDGSRGSRRRRHQHYVMGAACAFLLAIFLFSVSSDPAQSMETGLQQFVGGDVRKLDVPPLADIPLTSESAKEDRVLDLVVEEGDSLAVLFERNGIRPSDLHAIMKLGGPVSELRALRPGDRIKVAVDDQDQLMSLATR